MKKVFEMPGIDFEYFTVIDVITTSSFEDDDTGEGGTTIVNPFAPKN